MKTKATLSIIDAGTGFESRAGYIPGAIHAPTWKVLLRLARIPSDKNAERVVTCKHGPLARFAKGLMGAFSYKNMALLSGHMAAWRQTGRPY